MKRIILFRFHKNLDVCRNKLQILRHFNPDVKIYGMFGGDENSLNKFKKGLGFHLEHIYLIKGKSPKWKWFNCDLAVNMWYKDYGHKLDFDMLYIVEWDELLLTSLAKAYSNVPKNSLGLTALTPLDKAKDHWNWTSKEPYKSRWIRFMKIVKDRYGYDSKPYGCIFGGTCLPKSFLERYSKERIPQLCHDEIRVPVYAQIYGFKLFNNGFVKKFYDKTDSQFFHAFNNEISDIKINAELKKIKGRRVFHPYRRPFPLGKLKKIEP
ncbi:MAG: hypothetical protein KGH60_02165 [Candidatus Micrarchaeota archaeon]|nr:hypothetical protein [Candidatus Micrarchaeota archaeon]